MSTIGEMIVSILDWPQEVACIAKASKFLEALPASSGVTLDQFVTKLSCTMVHIQMQRTHDQDCIRVGEVESG